MSEKIDFNNLVLNQDYILSKISEKEIFDYYVNRPYKLQEMLKSNLRTDDDTESLNIYYKDGKLKYKDFGHSQGNCFEYVKNLYQCEYNEALDIIAKDFGIIVGKSNPRPKLESVKFIEFQKTIIPVKRGWKSLDKNYWTDRYYIPLSLLVSYNIFPAQHVYLKNRPDNMFIWASHTDNNPIYCYQIDNSYKCYRPLNQDKKGKWISTTSIDDIQGMKQLPKKGELLIITSSMKDVLVLRVLGYDAIALGGEGNHIPDYILDYLWACFDNIIVFYDNDKPGLEAGIKTSESIGAGNIHIPIEYKEKDISDFTDVHRLEETVKLMNKLI